MEASWWEGLTEGETGSCSGGLALLSKSLIQLSVDRRGSVPFLLFDLRPNYGGGNEENGDLLQKVPCLHCHTQCPRPCSRPPPTHTSTRDSWTLTGKSGSASCGVTASFFWVLVHMRFCFAFQSVSWPASGAGAGALGTATWSHSVWHQPSWRRSPLTPP